MQKQIFYFDYVQFSYLSNRDMEDASDVNIEEPCNETNDLWQYMVSDL